jgi:hypothetical protein
LIQALKILILGSENCGLIHNLSKGFKDIGISKVKTAILQSDIFFPDNKYDFNLAKPTSSGNTFLSRRVKLLKLIKWKVFHLYFSALIYPCFDVYVFTWLTLDKNYKDLATLRKRGKQIVFLFIGSEVRWIEAFRQEFQGNPYNPFVNEDWKAKFRLIRNSELYSSAIFSAPDQSTLFIRGYFYLFMPLIIDKIKYLPFNREVPIIIHAPSKRNIKGTEKILDVIERLHNDGIKFDFHLLENIPNKVLVEKLEQADILIDQIYLNGPAVLSSEAMAAGCAVATRFFDEGATKDAPLCYIDEACLYDNLKTLIVDVEYRKKLVGKGRLFVEKNNTPSVVAKKLLVCLERDKRGDYDYRPTFFLGNFKLPENYSYTEEIEDLNRQVKIKSNEAFKTNLS